MRPLTPFQRLILATAAISVEPVAVTRPPEPEARPCPVFPPKRMLLPRDAVLDLGLSAGELAELDADAAMAELGPEVAPEVLPAEPPRAQRARPYRPNRAAQRAEKKRHRRFG